MEPDFPRRGPFRNLSGTSRLLLVGAIVLALVAIALLLAARTSGSPQASTVPPTLAPPPTAVPTSAGLPATTVPSTAGPQVVSTSSAGAGPDYGPILPAGDLAVPVTTSGAAGLAQSGDDVDFAVTYRIGQIANPTSGGSVDSFKASESETQALIEGLRVLSTNGQTYVVAANHQDALLLKWAKDTGGTIDLYVRANADAKHGIVYFKTRAVLPSYLFDTHGGHRNAFTLP